MDMPTVKQVYLEAAVGWVSSMVSWPRAAQGLQQADFCLAKPVPRLGATAAPSPTAEPRL